MSIFDQDRWNEIWETINRNRKRSIMTAFGVFWGIFMLTVMAGAGKGLGDMMRGQLGDMAVNSCFYFNNRTSVPYQGFASGRRWWFENDDMAAISKQVPGVEHVAGWLWGERYTFVHGDRETEGQVMGYMPEFNVINPRTISYGRYINDIDMDQRRKVCVIGTQIWKELFPGGENPVGTAIRMNGVFFTVVGVYVPQRTGVSFSNDEQTLIIPFTTLQKMYNMGNQFHGLAVTARDDVDAKRLNESVEELLKQMHHISPDDEKAVGGFNLGERFAMFNNLFVGIAVLTWIVGIGTLLAGIVGISNIMLVVVRERTQEIGVRRALGAPPGNIISQVMSESFVLTFIAGIAGLALAVGILSMTGSVTGSMDPLESEWSNFDPQISFGTAMASLAILVAGGLAAGIIPAVRALKIKPVDAIREE